MKIIIDPKTDTKEDVQQVIDFWYGRNTSKGQQKITPVCEKCGTEVDQKVVNYCKVQYQGKIICRDCQGDTT